ncbi:hypothetical protein EVA_07948 [gut metagenome]|uniref:Uncharacterized protein n=1 Tax=gut metagenome TaxID=749906 RepID=J9GAS3_9ZZZZ
MKINMNESWNIGYKSVITTYSKSKDTIFGKHQDMQTNG